MSPFVPALKSAGNDPLPWRHNNGARAADPYNPEASGAPEGGYTFAPRHDYDDPELWQPGDVKEIPTVLGLSYSCTITRVLPSVIEFDGPTGPGCITRELYAALVGAGR